MIFTKKALATLALLAGIGSAHAAPLFVQLSTGNGDLHFGSTAWGTNIYTNASFKINDRYSFTPEFNNHVTYNAGNGSFLQIGHDYLRVTVSDKKLAKVGGMNLGMAYRYILPTDLGSQAAGNLGTLVFRPALSTKMGPVDFLVRDGVGFYLNRNAYQVNPTGPVAKGNPVLSNAFEFLPSMELAPNLDLGLVVYLAQKVKAADQGGSGTTWLYTSDFEIESGYTVKELGDARFALNLATSMSNQTAFIDQFKVYKMDNTAISLSAEKTF